MSVRPRYRAHEEDEQKTFWLEFHVCSDGFYDQQQEQQQPDHVAAAAAEFTCFPALPYELRLKIWECLLTPRIVIATCFDGADAGPKRAQLALRKRLPPVPVLLHISHETRTLALKHYELAFSWRVPSMYAHPLSSPARTWFNFHTDTLLLLGELEPYGSSNMNAPMVYFLNKADTRRVRHVACAFEELHLGEVESEQVFGCLFHVLDEFRGAERLVITSTDEDLVRYQALRAGGNGSSVSLGRGMTGVLDSGFGQHENVVQKIWWGWIHGTSVVTSHLRDKQILMVREDGLADFIAEHL